MDILIALVVGAVLGGLTIMFMIGATQQNRELDVYMEGFNDGQKAPKSFSEKE